MSLTTVTEARGQITAPWPKGLRFWTIKQHRFLRRELRIQCQLSRYFDRDGWRLIIFREVESPEQDPIAPTLVATPKIDPSRAWARYSNLFYAFLRSDLTYDEALELSTTLVPVGFSFESKDGEPVYWGPDFDRRIDPREMLLSLNTRYEAVKRGERNKRVIPGINMPQTGSRPMTT